MKERPILFSAPMVRALLAGTKTQTRRIVKPQPFARNSYHDGQIEFSRWASGSTGDPACAVFSVGSVGGGAHLMEPSDCPYGCAGDRLWVRETFAHTHLGDGSSLYVFPVADPRTDYGGPWKPSIHMPRAASRITLEITGVRVERLNDIDSEDVLDEGCDPCLDCDDYIDFHRSGEPHGHLGDYRRLWESINGPGSWDANPWVWVVEFRRLSAPTSTLGGGR